MKYIKKETFEFVLNHDSTTFAVDDNIASAVQILNKKGYLTKDSGACINDKELVEYTIDKARKDIFDENNIPYEIISHGDVFLINGPKYGEYCYVEFLEEEDFAKIPADFTYKNKFLSYPIIYYKDNVRRSDEEIEMEILKVNAQLLTWALRIKGKGKNK